MGIKFLTAGCAAAFIMLAVPAQAQSLDNGGTVASQDSIVPGASPQDVEIAQHDEILAAETNLNFSGSFMHTQYHENYPVYGQGDDENGSSGGFGIGASVLLPRMLVWPNVDLYSALDYEFSGGNLNYVGHYQDGTPLDTVDRAVFNRIEARAGLGFPLLDGVEMIPFIAAGYQAWNRNVDIAGDIGTDEHYTSTLLGGGLKVDAPVTNRLVLSGSAEMLAMIASSFSVNNLHVSQGLGGSAQEKLALGADYAVSGKFHVFATTYWEHFNYAGDKPTYSDVVEIDGNYYNITEPLSTTTQIGANIGVAYSF